MESLLMFWLFISMAYSNLPPFNADFGLDQIVQQRCWSYEKIVKLNISFLKIVM